MPEMNDRLPVVKLCKRRKSALGRRKKYPVQVMGFLGLRYSPATRAQTDRRRISAARASQTPGFEDVVRDGAFSARADFQPVPRGLTNHPVTPQARCARSVVAPEKGKIGN